LKFPQGGKRVKSAVLLPGRGEKREKMGAPKKTGSEKKRKPHPEFINKEREKGKKKKKKRGTTDGHRFSLAKVGFFSVRTFCGGEKKESPGALGRKKKKEKMRTSSLVFADRKGEKKKRKRLRNASLRR